MFGKKVYRKMFVGMVSVFIIALAAAIAVAGGTGEPPQPTPGQQKPQQVAPAAVTEITMSAVFPYDLSTGDLILIGDPNDPNDWPAIVSLTATGQCQGTAVSFGPGIEDVTLPSYIDSNNKTIQITIATLTADLLQKYFFLNSENQATVACYPPGSVFYAAPTAVMDFQRYVNIPADTGIPNMIVTAKVVWMGVTFK